MQSAIVAATGQPNLTVATLGGQAESHILGETIEESGYPTVGV